MAESRAAPTRGPLTALAALTAVCLIPGPANALQVHAASPADPAPVAPLDTAALTVWTGSGEPSSLDALTAATADVDVVLLGESHDDLVGHALQRELLERILARDTADRTVVLSLEMFERDVQYILDEYLDDLITGDQFRRSSRPWRNYDEDYAATVDLAKAANAPVIAANAPRRYVNLVSREGPGTLHALSDRAKDHLAPLPWEGPSDAYLAELRAMTGAHGDTAEAGSAAGANGFLAQSLWDATMAHSIATALMRWPGARVVHLVGSFHVMNGTGIPEQLERYRPGTRRLIVFVAPVADIAAFDAELRGAGDFVVLTDRTQSRPTEPPG